MDALRRVLLFLALVIFQPASAVVIEYELTDLGGDRYRYDYTVINDGSLGAGVSVQLFDILFDPPLYDESSLSIVSGSSIISDWDEQILSSFPPFAAAYDLSAISSGVLEGNTISGFAVEFNWLDEPAIAEKSPHSRLIIKRAIHLTQVTPICSVSTHGNFGKARRWNWLLTQI